MAHRSAPNRPRRPKSRITVKDFNRIIRDGLPWLDRTGARATAVDWGAAIMCLPIDPDFVRPGGTISGPTMMMLADATMYAVVLSQIGEVQLAVTTNFNINFLRKPPMADLVAEGRMIKLGSRLAVMEVTIFTEGEHDPIAHATGTYSIPPRRE